MKLCSIFGLVVTSGLHFSTVDGSPITVELPIRPSQILNITSAFSGIRERPNLRLGTGCRCFLYFLLSARHTENIIETSTFNFKAPDSCSNNELLTTMPVIDPIHLSIRHSTLSLDMAKTPKGDLNPLEVEALLHIVLRGIHTSLDEPVQRTTWFQDPSNPNGPHFAVTPQILLRELTWREVTIVVQALLDYYHNQASCPQIAFLIHDAEKGAMGSGGLIIKKPPPRPPRTISTTWRRT